MPAGVDAQTHLRVPGQAHKELPQTGFTGGAQGRLFGAAHHAQHAADHRLGARAEGGQEQAFKPYEKEYGVHVFWSAAITLKLNSDEPTLLQPNWCAAGVRAFTNDGLGVNSDAVMEQSLRAARGARRAALATRGISGPWRHLGARDRATQGGRRAFP